MIQIEDVKELPQLTWTETSGKEFMLMPSDSSRKLVQSSFPVKLISADERPLLVAGLFHKNYLSIPYLWTLITAEFKNASPATVRAVVRLTDAWAPRCETLVEYGNKKAERLAKVFGFSPVDGVMLMNNQEYRLHRRG